MISFSAASFQIGQLGQDVDRTGSPPNKASGSLEKIGVLWPFKERPANVTAVQIEADFNACLRVILVVFIVWVFVE